jgi:acetyl-CoA carboxylase carboxyl transferase subunit beta
MAFLNFRRNPDNALESGGRKVSQTAAEKNEITCPNCHRAVDAEKLAATLSCCPHCGHHFSVSARERINMICDRNSFVELFGDIVSKDPLQFHEYGQKLAKAQQASGENEAVICGTASIGGAKCAFFVMEGKFMMGSMGAAVGERITRLFEHAIEKRLPVVGYTVSGGARMQEGMFSLLQMAKVSAAARRHSDAGLLYITVLTDPTTGGVTASFAMLGDIILAEPRTTIGFAGRRVIEGTIGQTLPDDFQSSEFLLSHGFCDKIVPRNQLRETLEKLLKLHCGSKSKKWQVWRRD